MAYFEMGDCEASQQTFALMKASWRRLLSLSSEGVFKSFFRCLDQDEHIHLGHTFWTRLQGVLQKRLQDIFKTSSRWFAKGPSRHLPDFFKTERFVYVSFLRNFWSEYKFAKSQLFGYPESFQTVFLKHFMKWLLLQINIFLLSSSIRRDVFVYVNRESVNENSSKIVFLRFQLFTLLHFLVAA